MMRLIIPAVFLLIAPLAAAQTDWSQLMYAHGTVNIRAEPTTSSEVVSRLQAGDAVRVANCENNWCEAFPRSQMRYEPTMRMGYVSVTVLHQAPAAARPAQARASSRYIRGPRGGCYYINRNGNRTYVDRSRCN